MKTFALAVLTGHALSQAAPAGAGPEAKKPPNVLFIVVDDLNHWVGYLGRNAQTATPNIDKLAARGLRFTRSYCAAPVCNPSRAALLSGLRPSTTGVYENNNDWRTVIPQSLTLPTTFREAGYYVCGSGKIYHEAYRRRAEWDDYLADEGRDPRPARDTGVGGIKFAPLDCKDEDLREWKIVQYGIDRLGERRDRPMFLAVGLHKPHMPWNVPRKYHNMHPLDAIRLPPHKADDLADVPPAGVGMVKPEGDHRAMLESGRSKEAVQGYLAAVSYADAMIGRLIDAYKRSPERDNTVIVFGETTTGTSGRKIIGGSSRYGKRPRALLIWVAPGVTRPNTVYGRTVDFMSIYPTLTDLCGIPTPAHVEGTSIRRLRADPGAAWDRPALTTYRFKNHAVRSEGWRYIRYENGDEELYDERSDPYEWVNLANDPKHAATKAGLAARLPKHDHADIGPAAGAGTKKARAAAKAGRGETP